MLKAKSQLELSKVDMQNFGAKLIFLKFDKVDSTCKELLKEIDDMLVGVSKELAKH